MQIHNHNEIPFPTYQPNELDPRLIGMPGLTPFFRSASGPRIAMFNKHIAQRPTLNRPSSQRLQTGVSLELGEYTYKKALPENAYIVDVIPKYPSGLTHNSNFKNPLSTVIFENSDQEIDILNLTRYHSQHQYFGFEYKYDQDALSEVRQNNRITRPLTIADSPAKGKHGEYMFGIHANIALTSDEVGIEDGIKISESFAKRMQFTCIETRQIVFNPNSLGMNLYGDDDTYKLFPEIGERIRADGRVLAVRELSDMMTPALLSKKSLQRPTMYDTCIYGEPNAEVIDIKVTKGSLQQPVFFTGMEDQLESHHFAQLTYYKRVYDTYTKLKKQYGASLRISPAFSQLVREAIAVRNAGQTPLSYRTNTKLVGWMVEVTYKYNLTPVEGVKLTDLTG